LIYCAEEILSKVLASFTCYAAKELCTLLENLKLGAANRVGKLADLRSSHSLFTDATLKKEIKIKINKKKMEGKRRKKKKNKQEGFRSRTRR